jgi:hypothetical protein
MCNRYQSTNLTTQIRQIAGLQSEPGLHSNLEHITEEAKMNKWAWVEAV